MLSLNTLNLCFCQKENSQQNSQQSPQPGLLKRHTSLTDLSHAHEQQEVEYLRLQINEQRGVIEELTQVQYVL